MSNFYNQASWVLVPSGIEEDIVFAQKPTSGLGDLAFTRASDATYTDAGGVVRRSPYNLFEQTQAFDNAIWTKLRINPFGSGSVVNATTAPDGTMTAEYIQQENGQTTVGGVSRQISVVSGIPYTLSVFAKQSDERYLHLFFAIGAGAATLGCNFDLQDGIAGTTTAGTTATIQSVGNGWFRCSVTATSLITGSQNNFIRIANVLNGSTATPNKGIFIWGAQLVEGTSALDYFPTTNRQDVPRIDFRNADGTLSSCGRLLLEPQRTNSIRNSSMVGAVAGSPGTLPTNYIPNGGGGLTRTISVGTENGLPYIDLRYVGTATQGFVTTIFDSAFSASTGQAWTLSVYAKVVSGTVPTFRLNIFPNAGSGQSTVVTPTSSLNRFSTTYASLPVGTSNVNTWIDHILTIGETYDFTIRIAAPQMELGAYATTWVPTTTAAVTRIADTASKTGVSSLIGQTEGTVFLDLNYQAITGLSMFLSIRPNSTNKIEVYRDGTAIYGDILGNSVSVILSRVANPAGQYKIALAYKSGQTALYINGTSVGTSATAFSFATSMSDLFLNLRSGPTFIEQTFYNQAALFPTRLTNAQLAQLTTL